MAEDVTEVLAACALAALYCTRNWEEFACWLRERGGELPELRRDVLAAGPGLITGLLQDTETELIWRALEAGDVA